MAVGETEEERRKAKLSLIKSKVWLHNSIATIIMSSIMYIINNNNYDWSKSMGIDRSIFHIFSATVKHACCSLSLYIYKHPCMEYPQQDAPD